jgi:hypothetical protein
VVNSITKGLVGRMRRRRSFILKHYRIQRFQVQIGGEDQNKRRYHAESQIAPEQRHYPPESAGLPGVVSAGQPPDYCADDEAGIGREVLTEGGDFQRVLAGGTD